MTVSNDHTDLGAQIPFLGSEGVFSRFGPHKSILFLATCEILDRWMYHTTILSPKFRVWALMAYFCFLTPKSIFILAPCKTPDRWTYHTTILILGPGGQFLPF
jgi:hypothetical protein